MKSATSVQDVDFKAKGISKDDWGKVIFDWENLYKTMSTNPIVKEHIESGQVITLNWWCAEPLDWYKEAEQYFEFVKAKFPSLKFKAFISTNGIPLARAKVVDWVYKARDKYGLELQLSHDCVGQYIRTKTFDPLYSNKTRDVIVKLVRDGILTMFNATLNNYNSSPRACFEYLQKWRYENHLEQIPLYIKLNHNNDSSYTMDYRIRGPNLARYIHEMEELWMDSYIAGPNNEYFAPYYSYFLNQMTRDKAFNGLGGCGQFASGQKDWTWCCNTKGEYVFCQLCNDPEDVINPTCKQAKACSHCEFKHFNECTPCPDMDMSEDCGPGFYSYKQEYIRMVLRVRKWMNSIDSLRIENQKLRNRGK